MSDNNKKINWAGEIIPASGTLIHFLASLFAIILLIKDAFNNNQGSRGVVITLLLVSGGINIFFFFRNIKYRKAMRYREAYHKFTYAFRDIHMGVWENADVGSEQLKDFCNNLANAFEHVKGKKCHFAIKKTYKRTRNPTGRWEDDTLVMTIARDGVSGTERKEKRKKPVSNPVSKNNIFKDIIQKIQSGDNDAYFISDNLIEEDHFQSTSLEHFGLSYNSLEGKTLKEKKALWKLEYVSTIVVPICKYTNEIEDGELKVKPDIMGFFCIHSDTPNLFEKDTDPHILASCADAVTNIVPKLAFKRIQ